MFSLKFRASTRHAQSEGKEENDYGEKRNVLHITRSAFFLFLSGYVQSKPDHNVFACQIHFYLTLLNGSACNPTD